MKGIYWRTLTFKKKCIYIIKVNYTLYKYTPCNSTWTCLMLIYLSKFISNKINYKNYFLLLWSLLKLFSERAAQHFSNTKIISVCASSALYVTTHLSNKLVQEFSNRWRHCHLRAFFVSVFYYVLLLSKIASRQK